MRPLAKNAGRSAAAMLLAAFLISACGSDETEPEPAQSAAAQAQPAEQQSQSTAQEQQAQPAEQQQDAPAQSEAADEDDQPQAQSDSAPQQQQQAEQAGAEQQEAPAEASEGALPLTSGEPFRSAVGEGETREFLFTASAGDWLRVQVDGKQGMDPVLALFSPDGDRIAANDDVSRTNRDSLLYAQITADGSQLIRVGGYDGSAGLFDITASRHFPTADNDNDIIAIDGAFEVDGVLDSPEDVDVFEFDGRDGQEIYIYVDGAPGADVYIQLFDSDRSIIATDDDGGHGLDAQIAYALPETGRYTLEVWPAVTSVYEDIAQRSLIGSYSVHLREGPPEITLEDPDGAIAAAGATFLAALRESDSAAIFSLAGPEAIAAWGWENKEDVDRDLDKLKSIPLLGDDLQSLVAGSPVNDDWALFYVQFSEDDWFRIELVRSAGQWAVDGWTHSPAPSSAQTGDS